MSTRPLAQWMALCCLAGLLTQTTGRAAIAYNNTDAGSYKNLFYDAGSEFGNEIVMQPGDPGRVTLFAFDYYLAPANDGNEAITVRFYANDGLSGAPKTKLFDSGPLSINSGYQTMTLNNLDLNLPDDFTWTVTFGGIEGGEQAGLLMYSPPVVGRTFNDFWQLVGNTWTTMVFPNANVPANFGALVIKGSVAPPVLAPIADKNAVPGVLLTFTNTVTDPSLSPGQRLVFSLSAGAPAGASIDDNGVFAWTPSAAQAAAINTITVMVTDNGTSLSDQKTFRVFVAASIAPAIKFSPVSQTTIAGNTVLFNVIATGTALLYQWRYNTGPIAAATNAAFTLANVQTNQAGNYDVVVSNVSGTVTSAVAVLTVVIPPVIVNDPASQTVTSGANVLFNVTATGTAPLSYQWQTNGVAIPNATNAALTVLAVQPAQAGGYNVVVSNAGGSVVSAEAQLVVNVPPSITGQPVSQTTVAGNSASFIVLANGTLPLSYQWQFNGAPIGGATQPILTLNNVQASQAGNYSVVVNNVAGSTTSSNAALSVNVPPSITLPPVSQSAVLGSNVTFNVGVSGTAPFTYTWLFNGQPLPGQTNATLTFSNVQTNNAGSYTVLVGNVTGQTALSGAAILTVNVPITITQGPHDVASNPGGTVLFTVAATGTLPISYQWFFNAKPIPDETNATLIKADVQAGDAGTYAVQLSNVVGVVTSGVAALSLNVAPAITTGPADQTVVVGSNTVFNVVASGTAPLTYQWLLNGNPLPGETNASLSLANVQANQAGQYAVTVNNVTGVPVTSPPATLTVIVPVTITQPPQNQTVTLGSSATFTVVAAGTTPLTYQWRFSGKAITGQTDPTLTLTNVQASQAGPYSIDVGNLAGTVSSTVATLTVNAPVTITRPPDSQRAKVGDNVVFNVTATGTPPLSYQWYFEGSPLAGATNASLNLSAIQLTADGAYAVVVSNPAGSVRSQDARLVVGAPPIIKRQPKSQVVQAGANITLDVDVSGTDPKSYQWQFNGAPLPGATAPTLVLNNVQGANGGNYLVVVTNNAGSATSTTAVVTVNVPVKITQPPASLTVVAGSNAVFTVVATGTAPLSYQWKFNGVDLPGANAATLTVTSAQPANAGVYSVFVSNVAGSDSSAGARLVVNVPVGITQQPQSQSVKAGLAADFSVAATGTPPLTYQWQLNGANLPGATNSTLHLPAVQVASAGNYAVVVSNLVNQVTSANAVLTVLAAPVLAPVPASTNVAVGSSVTFSVTATGQVPFGYQWLLNGNNIPGATNASYTIPNVQPANGGNYSVVVANAGGAVTSGTTALVPQLPPLAFADNLANIQTNNQAAGTFSGSNVGATAEPLEPNHLPGHKAQKSVWIGWQAPASGVVAFDTFGSAFDTVLAAYTGTSGAGLQSVAYNDDANGLLTSQIRFNAVAGTLYKIVVDGYEGDSGLIVLNWNLNITPFKLPVILAQPDNQTVLPTATNVTLTVRVDIRGITNPIYQWSLDGGAIPSSQFVTVTTGTNLVFAKVLPAFVGGYSLTIVNGDVPPASRANFGVSTIQAQLAMTTDPALVGSTPVVQSKPLVSKSPVGLQSWPVILPAGQSVSRGFTGAQVFSTRQAVKQAGEPNIAGVIGGAPQWSLYQPITNGVLEVSTEGSDFDTVLGAFIGPGTDWSGMVLQAADHNGGGTRTYSLIRFPVVAGTTYFIVIDGVNGAKGLAQLTYNLAGAPIILQQPSGGAAQNVVLGGNLALSIAVTNALAPVELTYQWRLNGAPIALATNSTLLLSNVTPASAGAYDVQVSNVAGVVTSLLTPVAVAVPVSVTAPPQDLTLVTGGFGLFQVLVSGTTPLQFQWRFNGAAITGATNASFALSDVQPNQAGAYSVEISNAANSVTNRATLAVLAPPSIVTQPLPQASLGGGTVTLSATATGSAPLAYQWRFMGVDISGATNASLVLTSVQPGSAGGYSVVVSNAVRSVLSQVAEVQVNVPITITRQPQSQSAVAGATVAFNVIVSGTAPLAYQWNFNGTALGGQTNDTLVLNNVRPDQAGAYSVAITNAAGPLTSDEALLTLNAAPVITQQPLSQTVAVGAAVTLTVAATGTGTLRYQWNHNGQVIPGATSASVTFARISLADIGNYVVIVTSEAGQTSSSVAVLMIVTPASILQPPQSQTVDVGATVSLSVVASGSAPLTYQWQVNGANIAGATNAALTLPNIQAADAGNYQVVVSNPAGSLTSAVAAVLVTTAVPLITQQPQSQTVGAGTTASLLVFATGAPPLSYQWQFNGADLPGATDAALTLANVQAAQAGSYQVIVTNPGGSVTSTPAILAVTTLQLLRFVSHTRQLDGSFRLELSGQDGQTYLLQGSTDLADWKALTHFTAGTGTYTFVDTNASTLTRRFYRASTAVLRIQVLGRQANGQVQLQVSGPSNSQVIIQGTSDLKTWSALSTNTLLNGQASFTDAGASSSASRLYRAVFVP